MTGKLPITKFGITTNGLLLNRRLGMLRDAGVNMINISLDTLTPSKFVKITRRRGFERVLSAIDAALAMKCFEVKVNCVVMRGFNDNEMNEFAMFTKERDLEVRFIEYMPFDENEWEMNKMVSYLEMISRLRDELPTKIERLPTQCHETSKVYRVDGHEGRLGFISSMTENFCSSCNRLRLTADGKIKVCLFGGEEDEVSLREAIRSGMNEQAVMAIAEDALWQKKWALGGHDHAQSIATTAGNRPMILIGG